MLRPASTSRHPSVRMHASLSPRTLPLICLLAASQSLIASPAIDLQKPPLKAPASVQPLSVLLPQGATLQTGTPSWEQQREEILSFWTAFLGPLPAQKAPLKSHFFEKEDLQNFTRQRVVYQIEEGIFTDAIILTPKTVHAPLPTVVVFHPTYENHYKRIVGIEGEEEPERQQAVQLVEQGYVVIAPRCFLWSELPQGYQQRGENAYAARVRLMQERHPDWKGMTRMLWDGIRAIDFAETLPFVDQTRLGIFGHSLGAKEALYLAAFDHRPKCVVFSEGGIGLQQSNWHDVWYLGPTILDQNFAHDHHELLALTAPTPTLLLAGGEGKGAADTDKSWLYVNAALPVFKLLKAGNDLGWLNHGLGHRYGAEARVAAEAFLKTHLGKTAP